MKNTLEIFFFSNINIYTQWSINNKNYFRETKKNCLNETKIINNK